MPPRTSRWSLVLLSGAAALSLTLTACSSDDADAEKSGGSGGSGDPGSSEKAAKEQTAKPALSEREAIAEIKRYSRVNNQANLKSDEGLLDTIEDDALYEMSVAGMKEDEGNPKAEPYEKFSYDTESAKLFIPRFEKGENRWFAAQVYSDSDKKHKYPRLLVMVDRTDHKRWEVVSTSDLDAKLLPKPALDEEGFAEAVDSDATDSAIEKYQAGVLDHYVTGGEKEGKVFAPTAKSKEQIKVHKDITGKFGSQGTSEFSKATNDFPATYSLRTADGGTLSVFGTAHTQTDKVAGPGLEIRPGDEDRAWLGTLPRTAVFYSFICQNTVQADKSGRTVKLTGYVCNKTDVKGPPA